MRCCTCENLRTITCQILCGDFIVNGQWIFIRIQYSKQEMYLQQKEENYEQSIQM